MQISETTVAGPDVSQATDAAQLRPRKASKTLLNFWVDAALFLGITSLVWISAMLQIVFPPPTLAEGWRLWGLSYNEWRNVQFGSLCICALLAIEHLVLHWTWVCSVLATRILRIQKRPDEGVQAIYGVGTFIVILLALLGGIIAAMFTVEQPVR